MKEKVLDNKKNGMGMMVLFILLYAVAAAAVIFGAAFEQIPLMVIGIIWASLGWIPFLGLKVLKPQEALVLTLFGKYVGTLKNDGFYWVNPFCTAVNPAAKTRLNQSGWRKRRQIRSYTGHRNFRLHKQYICKQKDFPEDHDLK